MFGLRLFERPPRAVLVAGCALLAATAFAVPAGFATDETAGPAASAALADPDFAAGESAMKAGRFADAMAFFMRATIRLPNNADLWNEIGYTSRHLGNLPQALAAYQKALGIDPKHRGATEYLGELYVQAGNLGLAEQQLDRLRQLCPAGCPEYRQLMAAIATRKTGEAGTPGGW